MRVFHPAGSGAAEGRVVWSGTPGRRDDAALVLVHDSVHWQPPTSPVRWGRAVTDRPAIPCETWGVPDIAQRPGRDIEAEQLRGRLNPGTGFVGNQHVVDLDQPAPVWRADGASPFAGLSGAAVFCDRLLTGVIASDRAHSGHGRLNAVPAYVLHHDAAFRAALAEWGAGPSGGLQAVEFQDLADRAQDPDRTLRLPSPAALLQARHQIVPFHGRDGLLGELTAWCRLGGFGAWLLHGPGGQGKTRLAHHLAHQLAADGWAVLWPRTTARAEQLRDLRHAARPFLVVLDYAESRTDQITALVEAAADHPADTPFKLLLLARTDGDWWQQATTATSLAEDYLAAAHTRLLNPLDDTRTDREQHYRDAAEALTGILPQVDGLPAHDWPALARTLRPPRLDGEAYGNALTLHMTALADLLDTAEPRSPEQAQPVERGAVGQEADLVEDRLLTHERRHWRQTVLATAPALSLTTLETALAAAHLAGAADREQADRLWQRLPVLEGQNRDRRDRVTAWLATLYPAPGGPPWGTFQPDRLAERHIGRVLETDPALADHLLNGADDTQTAQLLTVYSRAAAHPVLRRLDNRLTDLCIRHHQQIAAHIITTATRTNHPGPLITALDTVAVRPGTPLDTLIELHSRLPPTSQRLAATAVRLAHTITGHYRALAKASPGTYLSFLASALNDVSFNLGEVGRWEEGLAAAREATGHYRSLAEANPAYLPFLAGALNTFSSRLTRMGRAEEAVAAAREATGHYRNLAEANPAAHLPDLATSLSNLSLGLGEVGRREEAVAVVQEAVTISRTLAEANPDAHLPNLAVALNNLSARLSDTGRWEEGLAAAQEAATIRRTLTATNPDAHLPDLAGALSNLSLGLGGVGRWEEGLAAVQEAVTINRALAGANPDAHLPNLARILNSLSLRLTSTGRWKEALAAVQEAVTINRALAGANPDAHLPNLASTLNNLSNRLGETGWWEEALTTTQEALAICRALAGANPDAHLPNLAGILTNLSIRLGEMERWEEALTAGEEAVAHYRSLVSASPNIHLPGLARTLNNLSNQLGAVGQREEALTAVQEATGHYRALAGANPGAHLPNLAGILTNLSNQLGAVGRKEEALATIQEATGHYRTLVSASPDIHLPGLARTLNNLSNRLVEAERWEEALTAGEEAVAHYRSLVSSSPNIHLPGLAMALNNLSLWLVGVGRREGGLAAIQEATKHYRVLATANAIFETDLQRSLKLAALLQSLQ
ncbi:tetratricopeptide repeat protein [Kitasatospora sp. NPDC058406]|uniref:tetratricopeptide repeat protein n=1 Tax=Kitasatospora sp. NPDC058406 TaxID=3346483 RepID=UPI00365B688A